MKRHFTLSSSLSSSNKIPRIQQRHDEEEEDDDDDVFHTSTTTTSSACKPTTTITKKPIIIVNNNNSHLTSTPPPSTTPTPTTTTTTVNNTTFNRHAQNNNNNNNTRGIIMTNMDNEENDEIISLSQRKHHYHLDSDEQVYATARAMDQKSKTTTTNNYDRDDQDEGEEGKLSFKRDLDQLKPVDHHLMNYPPFKRNFHIGSRSITSCGQPKEKEVVVSAEELRRSLGIRAGGVNVPDPIQEFKQMLGLDRLLIEWILNQERFEKPTPIQMQAIPCILSGRDVIGIARTGSGKTGAYVWPMIVHVLHQQRSLKRSGGPIALMLAPTRELAIQIYTEIKKYTNSIYNNLRVVPIVGGGSKTEQFQWLKKGTDIVVATPGRMIDLLQLKACSLSKVTYLVLDEADLMLNFGFEQQVRTLISQIRPDRQFLMFSATFDPRLEQLAKDTLNDHVRIAVGQRIGSANCDITQSVSVVANESDKWRWLSQRIGHFLYPYPDDKTKCMNVLIFVNRKEDCDKLATRLNQLGYITGSIHGDKGQEERQDVISAFKRGVIHILVATDVASRGLDIPSVKTVVNYEVAKDIDSHTHRIGRTGRAGDKDGMAYTLISHADVEFAPKLVQSLEESGHNIPQDLMDLAMKVPRFNLQRQHTEASSSGSSTFGANLLSQVGVKRTTGVGYKEQDKETQFISGANKPPAARELSRREATIQSLTSGTKSNLQHQFLTGFVKKEVMNQDKTDEQPKPKKFEIIAAKNPKPIPKEQREQHAKEAQTKQAPPQSVEYPPATSGSCPQTSVPLSSTEASLQQQLIYQQYQAYLARKKGDSS